MRLRENQLRRYSVIFLLTLTILGFVPAWSVRPISGQVIPFGPGETFQYQIKWNLFSGGKMSFSVKDDVYLQSERAFHLQAETETAGMFKKLYPFRARVDSFVSQKDFQPLRYQYSSWAPEQTRLEIENFPRGKPQGQFHVEENSKGKSKQKDEVFPMSAFFQDPLSILYYLRTQELSVGDQLEIPVSADQKACCVVVKVLRKTRIRAMGKTWNAFVLEPGISLEGMPFKTVSVWIWVSADEARIPLYISGRAALGVISATLVKITEETGGQSAYKMENLVPAPRYSMDSHPNEGVRN